ncbi:MAG: TIGR03087 family PEP-CTERM/XrtA system glycosyltransferase [Planctomycetes bacterium]|nr:TIGR03087 family PEP-CTERM/XrtA system glycosyltransferase [Planctomycetota bacterium]
MTVAVEPPPTPAPTPATARRAVRKVLLLTHRLPYPPDRGDRIRSYNLVRLLSRHFDLAVACTSDEPVWLQHHQLLRTMAKRVTIQPISGLYCKARSAAAILTGGAATPASFYRVGLAEAIQQWHEQDPFDAVLTFCTGMIHYARLLTRGPNPPRHVLDLVDVDSIKWRSYAQGWSPKSWVFAAESRRLRRIEAGEFDRFDAVTVVSDAEAKAYREHVGDHPGLAVVGNGVDLDYFHPLPEPETPNTICFVGVLNYKPNADGIAWFVKEVMPLLRHRLPDAQVLVVGRHPTPAVLELGNEPGVEVVGSVPDVRLYIERSSAVIAPLQIARGVQNKVLEAMACRRAVVCSPGAAQGINATDGEHLLVADRPAQWADHLHRLLTDAALRKTIADAARTQVERRYTWEDALAPMVHLLKGE